MRSVVLCLVSVVMLGVRIINGVLWDQIRCTVDTDQHVPEGIVPDIGRFPWLGVVQHNFLLGGKSRFAITSGILIHPAYAIAPAEDMARILHSQVQNSTKFILWRSSSVKYALGVAGYSLHPEYERGILATVALLELLTAGETGVGENPNPVLPVCLPIIGAGVYADLHAVKITDRNMVLQKEAFKLIYVEDKVCDDFYQKNELISKKMTPVFSICARTEQNLPPCVWDAGVALITRQSWGFWKLLGFSVRGPGCGAPAKFLNMIDYMPWINDQLSELPLDHTGDIYRIGVRRLSPIKLVMYDADKTIPKETGHCDRKVRGTIIYKEAFEILMTANFAQGFFYLVVSQLAQVTCAIVSLDDISARSNTAVWLEHYCHREMTGIAHGHGKPRDVHKQECFLYFKTGAFLMFRFTFSFKTTVEAALYGRPEIPRIIPNPWATDLTTFDWFPTNVYMRYGSWQPSHLWAWNM